MYITNKSSRFECILRSALHKKCSSNSAPKRPQGDALKREIKAKHAKILKRFNTENKLLFGGLVETLPQKKERELNEPSEINKECNYGSDKNGKLSEAWWWKESLKTIRVRVNDTAPLLNECVRASTSMNVKNTIESEHTKVSRSNVSLGSHISRESAEWKDQSSLFHKSNFNLPQIMVRNITKFPLHNKNEQDLNPVNISSILNIPLKEESDSMKAKYKEYPSVSRILNATMSDSSRAALQKWKENMMAELGEEGFQKYQRELLEHGKMFHSTVQTFLSGVPVQEMNIDPAVEGSWHSLGSTVKEINAVKVLESHVVHEELLYHGIIDCVAAYKGKLLLIEWKKSNKQKSTIWNTYDAPLQLAAYLGAMNFDHNYKLKVDGGLVVVAYTDGSPAHVHHLGLTQCEKYWRMWLGRLKLYWELYLENKSIPGLMTV